MKHLLAPSLAVILAVTGCGSGDENDEDNTAAEETEDVLESVGARGLAEALRVVLLSDNMPEEQRRDVDVLQENVDDLPGDPEVTGIEDADGDGRDDDGKLQMHVDDEVACVSVADGGRVDVTGGEC